MIRPFYTVAGLNDIARLKIVEEKPYKIDIQDEARRIVSFEEDGEDYRDTGRQES